MLDILVVDDEPAVRWSVAKALTDEGHRVTEAEDGEDALRQLLARVFDVAVFDVRLPKVDGLTLFRRMRLESPGTVVILMTAYTSVADAVATLRAGAHDYVTKPFDPEDLAARVVRPIAEHHRLRQQFEVAREQLTARDIGTYLVGVSPFVARLRADIAAAAQSTAPLLLRGEPGTGKRLVARIVHDRGPRRAQPYVAASCASFLGDTLEGELFGYARGAFAGATHAKAGSFVTADGGTLLLDDVGAMPLPCQARLLATLRDGTATPIGSLDPEPIDVRVIATSHEDLEQRVAEGSLRADLLRKLGVLELTMTPLRSRPADLAALFEHFMQRFARGVPPKITLRAWNLFRAYGFPGNVDEMADAVKHVLATTRGSAIDAEHLPPAMLRALPERGATTARTNGATRAKVLGLGSVAREDAATGSEGPDRSKTRS